MATVSGTLIHIPNRGYILLDAGEGHWGQLVRKYGADPLSSSNIWQVLRELRCIFISHIHGDHHIGLSKVLTMRQQVSSCLRASFTFCLRDYEGLEILGLRIGCGNPVVMIPAESIH